MKNGIFKSAVSVLLCVALLTVSMFTVSVFADDTAPSVELKSANVRVDDSIGLKVVISAKNVGADTVKLIADGTEYPAEKNADGDFEAAVLKYPVQMMDKISLKATAVGIDGKTYESAKKNDYTIAGNLEKLYNDAKTEETTKTFIAKLANYGAYTQIYAAASKGQTLDADELANYFLDSADKTPSSEAYKAFEDNYRQVTWVKDYDELEFKLSIALTLQSKVSLAFKVDGYYNKYTYYDSLGIESHAYIGTGIDDPNKAELEEHIDIVGDDEILYYTATYGSFAPTEYGETLLLRLFLVDGDGKLIHQSEMLSYDVGSYINRKCHLKDQKDQGMAVGNEASKPLYDLLNAMAEYSVAASAMNQESAA